MVHDDGHDRALSADECPFFTRIRHTLEMNGYIVFLDELLNAYFGIHSWVVSSDF